MFGIKSDRMEDLNITFHFKGDLKELSRLEQVDCCILLANLLDNAVEANAKTNKDGYITLIGRKTENLLYMEMRNPSAEKLQKEGQRILSTKKTDTPSGIGLENVSAVVTKYHGECRCFTENGEFVFQLLLPLS